MLPVLALAWRVRQDEYRRHVLIGRPAFGGLAPAQQAFQPQAHHPLVVQFGTDDEQAVPLI
ncbi:MAG TPA: hypothetical protein VFQ36_16390 [Ktedonobacteraceae bacterium]|nr:hypothetical protein [Ktedonobacteraceae bacterium]